MASSKLLILLSVALFATSILAQIHETDGGYKCSHGEDGHAEPDLLDIEEDFNPEGNDHEGRTLQSYGNLRAVGYYGFLRTSVSYFQNDLIPPILSYFRSALRVKYPVSGALRVATSTVCGKATPAVLRTGVTADYVLMVETYSQTSTVVAATQVCSMASGTRRPLVAYARINSYRLKATKDVLLHEKNMVCILHEVTHSLGFTSNMYAYFLNSRGQRQSGLIKTMNYAGYTTQVLTAEPLRTMLRNHFGCSSLAGAVMENTGGAGTAGQHFERRMFSGFEFMTSGLIYEMQVSKFTLGLLESTGWYVPNYAYADDFHWGRGQGCSFVTGTCSASRFGEWCANSGKRCTNPGKSAGTCSSDVRSDGCKFVHPNVAYHCDSTAARNYARLPSAESYGRGQNSRCFEGTLSTSSGAATTAFCFKFSCSGSRLTVHVGGQSAVCTKAGAISVPGYRGTINCPNPSTFCTAAAKCPRGCMGRGSCVGGRCSCAAGYKGVDCALRSAF